MIRATRSSLPGPTRAPPGRRLNRSCVPTAPAKAAALKHARSALNVDDNQILWAPLLFNLCNQRVKVLATCTTPARMMAVGGSAAFYYQAQVRARRRTSEEVMGGDVVRPGTINVMRRVTVNEVVRQITVDEQTLERIAELLGIPEQVIGGTIYIRTRSSAPSGSSPSSPGAPPSSGDLPASGTPPPSGSPPSSGRRRR
jgi:hypothetical protein